MLAGVMRAITYRHYGPPDVLECVEVATPEPADDEVLVRVRAASVNPLDWHFMRGSPFVVRIMTGIFRPKDGRLGVDLAGVVEAAGASVTRFRPGDEVLGASRGTVAEVVSAPESRLVAKPDNITFEEAAAVPIAGITALQGLRDKGRIQAGQKVLVIGAAGGVGTFAVQIAKSYGAQVTGVCSTRNVEMVTLIGADHVVDYTRDDFSTSGEQYDIVLDCIGNRTLSECRRVMSERGIHVAVGGDDRLLSMLLGFVWANLLSMFVSQRFVSFLAAIRGKDLAVLAGLMEDGKVAPTIDRRYPLEQAAEAIRYLETMHARGKVIISMDAP